MRKCVLLIFLLCCYSIVTAQLQLVLIKHDDVVIRFSEGDSFAYKRKNGMIRKDAFIMSLNDSTIITNYDTIAMHQIQGIYFKKESLRGVVGKGLIIGAAAIFVIDQVNTTLVAKEDPSLDSRVNTISLTALAIGLPLVLIKSSYKRVGYKQRLKIITRNSPFYYSQSRY